MAFTCASCVRAVEIEAPIADGDSAAILAVEDGGSVSATAFDLTNERRLVFDVPRSASYTLFLYGTSLTQLGIARGTLTPSTDPTAGRPIPRSSRIFHRGPDNIAWVMNTRLSPATEDFRFGTADLRECVERTGCYRECGWGCNDGPCTPERCSQHGRVGCPVQCEEPERPAIAAAGPAPPIAPLPPRLPTATSAEECPPGWTLQLEAKLNGHLCLPPPAFSCPEGQVTYGDFTCGAIDLDCSAAFPEPIDGLPAIYIDDDAPAGGSGSETAPYRTLQEALVAPRDGHQLLLAPGSYVASEIIDETLTLRGTCSSRTQLTGAIPDYVLQVIAPGVAISDLSITTATVALRITGAGEATLERIAVHGAARHALLLEGGASARARNLHFTGSRFSAITVAGGAHLDLEHAAIENVLGNCLTYSGGATGSVRAVRLAECVFGGDAANSFYLHAGADVSAEALWVEGGTSIGVVADHSRLVLRDSLFTAPRITVDGDGGYAVHTSTSVVELSNVIVERPATCAMVFGHSDVELSGVIVRGRSTPVDIASLYLETSTVAIERVAILDTHGVGLHFTRARGSARDLYFRNPAGIGIAAGIDSDLSIARARLAPAALGVLAETGARLEVTDLSINTSDHSDQLGLSLGEAQVHVERVEVAGPACNGISGGVGSVFTGSDVSIGGIPAELCSTGIYFDGGVLELERVRLQYLTGYGLALYQSTGSALLRQLAVRVVGDEGLVIDHGASLTLIGAELREFNRVGLAVHTHPMPDSSSSALLRDVVINCAGRRLACDSAPAAKGIYAGSALDDFGSAETVLTADHFLIQNCSVGLEQDGDDWVHLDHGFISHNQVGMIVSDADHPLNQLYNDVLFSNCTDLQLEF